MLLQQAMLLGCAGNTYPSLNVTCGDELTFMWPAGTPHGVALIPSSASVAGPLQHMCYAPLVWPPYNRCGVVTCARTCSLAQAPMAHCANGLNIVLALTTADQCPTNFTTTPGVTILKSPAAGPNNYTAVLGTLGQQYFACPVITATQRHCDAGMLIGVKVVGICPNPPPPPSALYNPPCLRLMSPCYRHFIISAWSDFTALQNVHGRRVGHAARPQPFHLDQCHPAVRLQAWRTITSDEPAVASANVL